MAKFSVKKPLTVFVVVLAIVVLGVVAYLRMTPDLLPNMDFPYVVIVTTDPGASPESVEETITRPMEQSMATLDRIKTVTSTTQNSVSMVMLEFEDGVNMDTISVDIQQKISILQGQWSDSVGAPYVLKINPSMIPVMVAAVSQEGKDVYALSDFVTDELTGKLEGVSGVASVTVSGALTREAHVILDQEKMDALSATLEDAVKDQLKKAEGKLRDAEKKVTDGQQALADAKRAAADGVAESVGDAVDKVYDKLKDIYGVLEDTDIDDIVGGFITDPDGTLKKLNDDLKTLQGSMEKLMKALKSGHLRAQVEGDVSDLLVELMDGMTQMTGAELQLSEAKAQIESGLKQIQAAYDKVAEQTDLGGLLSISTVSGLLTAQNFSMPAGYLKEDGVNYMVSVGDAIDTRQDLEDLVLFDLGMDGMDPIRMKDVADVAITDNSSEIYDKLNGKDGVIVSFNKQSTYATAEVSDNINSRFRELEAEYEGLSFVPLMDQGDYIYLIINSILSSLGWGALFSVLILYLFLRDLRPTVITLCSIPISVIFAVVLMYFSGVTINMISLSGLAVAVGMLVDNSVVVIENIYRLRAKGATVIQAAVSGARQVLGAITASTLTTVCVFLPIVFVEGITKQLFTDLALTMTYSLLASLIVALTLVPAMASGMLRKEKPQKPGLLDRVYPAYRKAVSWSLRHRAVVLLLSLVLLLGSAGATLARGFAFMPNIDMNTVNLTVSMPEGCTREQAVSLADEVLRRAAQVENVETVGAMMSSSGSSGGMDMTSMMSSGGGAYDVTAYITLTEGASGAKAGQQIEAACTGMDCTVTASGAMDSYMTYLTGSGVALNVYGSDMEQMQSAAKTLAAKLATVPGTENVSDGLEQAATALHLSVDRNAAMEKGLTVAQVYMAVASALTDTDSSLSLTLDGLDVSVSIQSPEESRMTREKLMDLEIDPSAMSAMSSMMSAASGSGSMSGMSGMSSGSGSMSGMSGMSSGSTSAVQAAEPVRLGDIAKLEETVSLNTIHRDQQRRYITVSADVADGYNVTKVTTAAQAAIAEVDLPQGITASFQGENEAIMDAIEQLLLMLLLGIVLVYLVMVAQFQSLRSPLIVMFTIPLAFTGGFLALLLAGIEVSVVSLVGFVMLVGVIVNNGIVLVDYINQLRLEGMGRREAIIEAGVTRLRPILMTSLTTILGLVVMAFGKDVGTALMQPVALVCIGGLLYATLMTLLVVPCMYDILSRRDLRKVNEEELQLLDL